MGKNLSGTKLGQYELRERLGRGGMAEVYKAYQVGMDRFVAVKIMLGHLADDEQFVERFRREAQAVGRLRHPHIVNVFDFGIENDVYYMVMEYIHGGTLKQAIATRGRLVLPDALRVTRQMADALAYAHQSGMIHRDLKPANIMFTDDTLQNAVLTDFGIARILTESGLTASGMMVGTPAYMSPEAGHGLPADERADIYALGIILYEMLTGQVPYSADTPMAVVMKHIMAPIPSLEHLQLPPSVEIIIIRAMAKKPEERYQSAADMRDAVDDAILHLKSAPMPQPIPTSTDPLMATNVKPIASAIQPPTKENDPTAFTMGTAPPTTQKSPFVWIVGLFALVAVIALVVGAMSGVFEDSNVPEEDAPISVFGPPPQSSQQTPTATTDEIESIRATNTALAVNAVVSPRATATETDIPTATPLPTEPATFEPTAVAAAPTLSSDETPNVEAVSGVALLSNINETMDALDTRLINGVPLPQVIEETNALLETDPNNADLLAGLSTLYAMAYDVENALTMAERAVATAPDNIAALLALSQAYLLQDNAESALPPALEAFALAPDDPNVLWHLSHAYYDAGQFELGTAYLYRAMDSGVGGYRAARVVGAALLENLEDPDSALPYLQAADASPVGDIYTYYLLTIAYLQMDDIEAAYELTKRYASLVDDPSVLANFAYVAYRAEDYDQALAWLDAAARQQEGLDNETWVRALVAFTLGDLDTADLLFKHLRAKEYVDDWPFLTYRTEHNLLLDHAYVQWAKGDIPAAIDTVTLFIDTIADYVPEVYAFRAELYYELGNWEAELQDILQAIRLAADQEELNLALINEGLQEAVSIVFEEDATNVELAPYDTYYSFEDSEISYLSGLNDIHDDFITQIFVERDLSSALADLEDILRENPLDTEALYTKFDYLLNFAGNYAAAEEKLNLLREHDPDDLLTYLAQADFYMHWSQNNYEAAREILDAGLEAFPDNPHLLWRSAYLYDMMGEPLAAERDFIAARENGASGIGYAYVAREITPRLDELEYSLDAAIVVFLAFPNDPNYISEIIQRLLWLENVDEALTFARTVEALVIRSPYHYNDLAYAAFVAEAYDQMFEWLQIAYTLSPDSRDLSEYMLGLWAWYSEGDADTAISLLTETTYEDNNSRFINNEYGHVRWYDVAKIQYETGDLEGALESITKVLNDYEWWWELYVFRAQVYLDLGEVEAAREDLNAALGWANDAEAFAEIESMLDALPLIEEE